MKVICPITLTTAGLLVQTLVPRTRRRLHGPGSISHFAFFKFCPLCSWRDGSLYLDTIKRSSVWKATSKEDSLLCEGEFNMFATLHPYPQSMFLLRNNLIYPAADFYLCIKIDFISQQSPKLRKQCLPLQIGVSWVTRQRLPGVTHDHSFLMHVSWQRLRGAWESTGPIWDRVLNSED